MFTYIYSLLIEKESVIVATYQWSFRVFMYAFDQKISSFFCYEFPLSFPIFVLSVLWYFTFLRGLSYSVNRFLCDWINFLLRIFCSIVWHGSINLSHNYFQLLSSYHTHINLAAVGWYLIIHPWLQTSGYKARSQLADSGPQWAVAFRFIIDVNVVLSNSNPLLFRH